ncbi:hypothetical protein EDB92DRAFT_1818373 [Lactarius akahatsu]|uniref:Uncharacterized protein n=1 Tax=Lactarius akahatsu TaxID=416441 RepID=A0AAD4LCL9_9AGAM|nr:hypothetical protein EDB92DRAFT_1818373 [Lactarius akahatsu]
MPMDSRRCIRLLSGNYHKGLSPPPASEPPERKMNERVTQMGKNTGARCRACRRKSIKGEATKLPTVIGVAEADTIQRQAVASMHSQDNGGVGVVAAPQKREEGYTEKPRPVPVGARGMVHRYVNVECTLHTHSALVVKNGRSSNGEVRCHRGAVHRGWCGRELLFECERHGVVMRVMPRVLPSLADSQQNLNLTCQKGCTASRHALRARIRAWLCICAARTSSQTDTCMSQLLNALSTFRILLYIMPYELERECDRRRPTKTTLQQRSNNCCPPRRMPALQATPNLSQPASCCTCNGITTRAARSLCEAGYMWNAPIYPVPSLSPLSCFYAFRGLDRHKASVDVKRVGLHSLLGPKLASTVTHEGILHDPRTIELRLGILMATIVPLGTDLPKMLPHTMGVHTPRASHVGKGWAAWASGLPNGTHAPIGSVGMFSNNNRLENQQM